MASALDESILRTVSRMVDASGYEGTDEYFDDDLLVHINTFMIDLYQNGLGDPSIEVDADTTWSDAFGDMSPIAVRCARDYLVFQTKLVFDPPASTAAQQSLKDASERLLYRIREQLECTETL